MTVLAKALGVARALKSSSRGLALVEFALLLPIMIALYFGTVEITKAVIAKRKLNLAVYTLADLTSQAQGVSQTDLTAIFGSASAVMAPVNVSTLQMRLSSIIVYPTGKTCVDWSQASGTGITPLTAGSTTFVMPIVITATPTTDTRDFIVAETYLAYNPGSHGIIAGTIALHEGPTYVVPRKSLRVIADTSIQSSSPCS